jgi:hypothetical protein
MARRTKKFLESFTFRRDALEARAIGEGARDEVAHRGVARDDGPRALRIDSFARSPGAIRMAFSTRMCARSLSSQSM